jgi:hypothetical protein
MSFICQFFSNRGGYLTLTMSLTPLCYTELASIKIYGISTRFLPTFIFIHFLLPLILQKYLILVMLRKIKFKLLTLIHVTM